MSADNWTFCPRCSVGAWEERKALYARLDNSYGVVSREEYKRLEAEAEMPMVLKDTLREDYEIGILNNKTFYVSYKARCVECGWAYAYKFEEPISLE